VIEPRRFGLYLHWPFCLSKCPYCDFNSHVRERIDAQDWIDGLLLALDRQAARLGPRRLDSIFFGGGTPSLMPAAGVAALIERANHHWPLIDGAEITLEANPGAVEAGRFRDYRTAGVNRVSLGVQALADADLRFLGRRHDRTEALAALDLAASLFDRWSFDLIYARPGQSVTDWQAELRQALRFGANHMSAYQLTIEEGTAFHTAYARGDFALPDDDLAGALYEVTQAELLAHGMPAYEISNHARPGQESRHNLVYWQYGDYAGIGPGAHGRLSLPDNGRIATRQHRAPETWLADLRAGGDGMAGHEIITADERRIELTMMGLRLTEGIPRSRFRRDCGAEPEMLFDRRALDKLIDGGFLILDTAGLRATTDGLQRLNALLTQLL